MSTEVSGSPLADRLVRVAQEAIFNEPTRHDEIGQQYTYDGRAAAAAVLRELADEFEGVAPDECHPADTIRRLAASVEEGER